jgi:hypothetical protein
MIYCTALAADGAAKGGRHFVQQSWHIFLLRFEAEIVSAAERQWHYLDVPLKRPWRDKMLADGSVVGHGILR